MLGLACRITLWTLALALWIDIWLFIQLCTVCDRLLTYLKLFFFINSNDSLDFRFLTKLLTEDLPRLFVRPKKIVLDFQKGKAVGPVGNDFKTGEMQEGNSDFVGELSVTLVDAQKLSYVFYGRNYFSLSLSLSHVSLSLLSMCAKQELKFIVRLLNQFSVLEFSCEYSNSFYIGAYLVLL